MPVPAAVALAVLLWFAAPSAAAWRPPVDGPMTRAYHVGAKPFESGQHRGIDLLARAGTPVRAPCAGRVEVAGRIGTSGGVVTVLCGHWRVSHMPLATIAVRRGTTISAGDLLGTVAPAHPGAHRGAIPRAGVQRGTVARAGLHRGTVARAGLHRGTIARAGLHRGTIAGAGVHRDTVAHAGLHLGVRRDGVRFGYVDPLRFLAPSRPTSPPPLGPAPRAGRPERAAHVPTVRPRPLAAPAAGRAASPIGGPAPWPAWAGVALVLAGVGVRWRHGNRARTRRRAHAAVTVSE